MSRQRRAQEAGTTGLACPESREHGYLLDLGGSDGAARYHCPHSDHSPRPKTHPAGERPATRSLFTLDEAERSATTWD